MLALGAVDAARLVSLATGRGGIPDGAEWPVVLVLLSLLAFVGTRILMAVGLTIVESLLVCALSPLLVLVDAPLGQLSSRMSLAANLAGCLIPAAVAVKVLLERRVPWAEGALLLGTGVIVAYFSSHVEPDRGVLLQYRVPAVVLGVLAAGLLYRTPDRSGAAAFMAGALGVVFGADVMHLSELASGAGHGRVVLGGAGLLDGILLVAILAAAIGELLALVLRALVKVRVPSEPTV
ncbi:MAG TPA: DUF1614 domain-containing protein [Candidatus Thermoplasmatota archaeon]|nr:DUF1614 domain-containing protein [Candidatus Thermoplasmatota archaeon]